jgi:serine phosphatase RsbU (regulator of sigma subunit)
MKILPHLLLFLWVSLFVNTTIFAQENVSRIKEKYLHALNQNNMQEAGQLLLSLCEKYRKVGNTEQASLLYTQGIEKFTNTGQDLVIAECYKGLGEVAAANKEYSSAIVNLQRAARFYKTAKDKEGYAAVILQTAELFINSQQSNKAHALLKDNLNVIVSLEKVKLSAKAFQLYALTFEQMGNKAKALEYRKMYEDLHEKERDETLKEMEARIAEEKQQKNVALSAKNKELAAKSKELASAEADKAKAQQLIEAEQAQIAVLNKEKRLRELEIQQKDNELKFDRLLLFVALGTLIVIIGVSLYGLKAYHEKQRINAQLAEQNNEIREQKYQIEQQKEKIEYINQNLQDSIRYAERIQYAVLPSREDIAKHLDYFLLFRPKDIVSGDFFWFAHVQENGITTNFFTVGDCTGHGVPGAFMSMIAAALLNESITHQHNHNPAQILVFVHKGIRRALQQEGNVNDDGIDAALCMIENANGLERKIVFAGAKRPLYYVANEAFTVIKGDTKSIGGRQKEAERVFHNHELLLPKGAMLYLCSDGYADQANPQKEKLGTAKLRSKLLEVAYLSTATQEKALAQLLDEHQRHEHQRDDITLVGIKV